jgi:hypothetical protein
VFNSLGDALLTLDFRDLTDGVLDLGQSRIEVDDPVMDFLDCRSRRNEGTNGWCAHGCTVNWGLTRARFGL